MRFRKEIRDTLQTRRKMVRRPRGNASERPQERVWRGKWDVSDEERWWVGVTHSFCERWLQCQITAGPLLITKHRPWWALCCHCTATRLSSSNYIHTLGCIYSMTVLLCVLWVSKLTFNNIMFLIYTTTLSLIAEMTLNNTFWQLWKQTNSSFLSSCGKNHYRCSFIQHKSKNNAWPSCDFVLTEFNMYLLDRLGTPSIHCSSLYDTMSHISNNEISSQTKSLRKVIMEVKMGKWQSKRQN